MAEFYPENEKSLASEIVRLAVDDYKAACAFYKKHKDIILKYGEHRKRHESAMKFFTSDVFSLYTDIDQDELLDYLEENFGEFKDV